MKIAESQKCSRTEGEFDFSGAAGSRRACY
jgi:hypothetical protein